MNNEKQCVHIVVLSDTHGYLAPQIIGYLKNADHIIHAGDIGKQDILLELESYAPLTAVHGNMDGFSIRKYVDAVEKLVIMDTEITITHVPRNNKNIVANENWQISIFGHTHTASVISQDHHLVINPGSASKPRFSKDPTFALLTLCANAAPKAEIIKLPKP
ncbi:YfcE family phosphodiesterase [candidate division KSB1 bacterium]|nr:YfcE family phosphodiesterase [candidate division KSB1 bacterium]